MANFNPNTALSISDYPDEAIITIPYNKVLSPGMKLFEDEDSYAQALALYTDSADVERIVRHESQHRSVGLAIGVHFLHYGLQIGEHSTLEKAFVYSQGGRVPKLAWAAMLTAPIVPSKYDVADVQVIGYRDVQDVGSRVVDWNKHKKGLFIPVPLSI